MQRDAGVIGLSVDGLTPARMLAQLRKESQKLMDEARGYLRREGDVLHVTDVAREHLVADSPWSLAPYYAALKKAWGENLERVFRNDLPKFEWEAHPTGE